MKIETHAPSIACECSGCEEHRARVAELEVEAARLREINDRCQLKIVDVLIPGSEKRCENSASKMVAYQHPDGSQGTARLCASCIPKASPNPFKIYMTADL